MLPKYCSPSKSKSLTLPGTCYENNEIIAIAHAYNNYIKKNAICKANKCAKQIPIHIQGKTSKELYKELSSRLNILCSSDMCWIDLHFINTIKDRNIRDALLYFTFKPKGTKTNNTWFSSININEIMDQYQDLHNTTFKFLGAQPSDFSKIVKINWKQLKNIKYIGIIFNTDNHLQSGQHWLGVFIDNIKKQIDYFDSLGNSPNKNITSFLKHFKNYRFTINKKKFQKGGSNCGVYSCYFIIQRLNKLSFNQITTKILTDKMMTDYRSFLFRPRTN